MAYGVNAPFGLRPFSSISGGTWTEKMNEYNIATNALGTVTYATSIFTGDPVCWSGTASQGGASIIRYDIDNATVVNQTAPVLGTFQGCTYTDVTGRQVKSKFWPASTQVYPNTQIKADILDDPDMVYDIQVSTATDVANDARFGGINSTAATLAYFGQNFGFGLGGGGANLVPNNPTAGSTATGDSAVYLNMIGTTATDRTTATLPLKVIGYSPNPENTVYTSTTGVVNQFLNVLVVLNNHVYRVGNLGKTPV